MKAPLIKWRGYWKQSKKGWKETLLARVADWLNDELFYGKAEVDITGPCGLCARCYVTFIHEGLEYDIPMECDLHSKEFVIGVRRYDLPSEDTFKPGTIGAINGMNHTLEHAPLEPEASWFRERMHVEKLKEEVS